MNLFAINIYISLCNIIEVRNQMTNRCLSTATRSNQGIFPSCLDIKANIIQDISAIFISKCNMVKLNMSIYFANILSIRTIYFRFSIHDFQESFKSCNTILVLFHEVKQCCDWCNKHTDRNNKC